jgi:signal transduction histidine kinase
MSLRARLLALFLLFAVVPLLALGGIEYVRSLRALEALIGAQNARVAKRIAETITDRAALLQSDLLLLAENAETQRWLVRHAAGRDDSVAAADASEFLRDVWNRIGPGYSSLVYHDRSGTEIYRLGAAPEPDPPPSRNGAGQLPNAQVQVRSTDQAIDSFALPVRDLQSGDSLGTVSLTPMVNGMLPVDALASGFGETGYGMVLDRSHDRVLYHPIQAMQGITIASLVAAGTWKVSSATLARASGTFRYRAGDTLRLASFQSLVYPQWTVVVSGAVSEFAGPFTAVRRWTLLLFLLVALVATTAFSQLLRRTTRSLEDLTMATAVVGRGDFDPTLPPSGHDEVGRLAASFETMVQKIRDMVSQIESSRQMAVLGEFAATLSHEVRNPLTSIKLNLQKLERADRTRDASHRAGRPLEIALREVARLDTVVRGVLDLARIRSAQPIACSLHTLAEETLEAVGGQGEGVQVERAFSSADDSIEVDPSQVKGALLNLVLNAMDAMPAGGTLRIGTVHNDGRIRLSVADSGPGIPSLVRAEIFRPFYTTKPSGTGLGLPLARRAVEENGGTLVLTPERAAPGTEFVIEFPLRQRVHA